MEQQLDRACALEDWRDLYPQTKVFHTSATYSDHYPILLNTESTLTRHWPRMKIQRFEERWVAHPECKDRIRPNILVALCSVCSKKLNGVGWT